MDDLALHRLYKRGIFPFRVNDNHIRIGVCEDNVRHFLFCCKGLACSRYAEDKGVAIEQVAAVSDNHIFADDILPVIHTVLMVDFLHTEGDKHRKALRGQGTHSVNLAHTKGERSVQPVHLLIFQHRKLAQMLSGCREQGFRVIIKLLPAVGGMHHRNDSEHHPLVTGRQVVQKFLAFLALLLKVIGDDR